jgi:hypothetical protein
MTAGLGASNTLVHRLHMRVRGMRRGWLLGSPVVVLDSYWLQSLLRENLFEELDSPRVPSALGL